MNPTDWLKKFSFIRTRSEKPDGRPLYAYKCREKEYAELKVIICEQLPQVLKGMGLVAFPYFFCLFAAETWRRCHEGGPWKWETVFTETGHGVPDYPRLYRWIEMGLSWWRRDLLRSKTGDREFLVTIACEGGLPLRLLRKEDVHLKRFFRQLLAAYHRERHSPSCDARILASHIATCLPRSLRHDIVFNLSAELIQKVVALQDRVADAADPLAALNQKDEKWRNELPLPLEDEIIELLLKNLVNEARALAITELQRVRWRRLLIQRDGEWTIEQQLELPNCISGGTLKGWTNRQDFPHRLRLLLHFSENVEQIALVTRIRGEGIEAVYRCEVLPRNGVRLVGKVAAAGSRLFLNDGKADYIVPAQGDEEWGPLPWIFGERNGMWEFVGEGSLRCREDIVFVLAPQDGRFEGDDGIWEHSGYTPSLQRQLYQIIGKVEWVHHELGACRIHCASAEASDEVFRLEGCTLSGVLDEAPPFLGMPSLVAVTQEGSFRRIDDGSLEWRPVGTNENCWRRERHECTGEVWIRYVDTDNTQRLRRKVRVVPVGTRAEIVYIAVKAEDAGIIRLTGLPDVRVSCTGLQGCQFQVQPFSNGAGIDCRADPGLSIAQFEIILHWADGRSMALQLPFPRQGAVFMRAGKPLPAGDRVTAGRLAAIQAIAQTPAGGTHFELIARIKSCNDWSCRLEIREPLIRDTNGRSQFDLHRPQDRILSLLTLSGDLDATAFLEIADQAGNYLTRLEVGQFDLTLEPDYENGKMTLSPASLARLGEGWKDRLIVRMVRLWAPASGCELLKRCDDDAFWVVPGGLEPGPWWVLGEDGDWPRFRPLLWVIPGEPVSNNSPLVRAIQEHELEVRWERLHDWVEEISQQPEHPDWPRFFEQLLSTRCYPASAFDLFRLLTRVPEAMVLALLKSSDEEFDTVWSLTYQLPFSWHLVPVTTWRTAAMRHFNTLREGLAAIDPEETMLWETFLAFRERVTIRQPFFRQICDWLSETIFPCRRLEHSELAMARQAPHIIANLIAEEEQKLQTRHDAEEHHPDGPQVMELRHRPGYPPEYRYKHLARPFRPVRCAPFVAAQISLSGVAYDDALLFELQRLRTFDKEWYDMTFALALCLGLAKLKD